MKKLLLFRAENQLHLAGVGGEFLDPAPDTLESRPQSFGAVLEPTGEVALFLRDVFQGGVIPGPIFPVEFVDGKNVVAVEPAAIQLPQTEHAPRPAVAVGEGMNGLELVV